VTLQAFFDQHPVFTFAEFKAYHDPKGTRSDKTRSALLIYHVKAGRLVRIRRGLYSVVPSGIDPARYSPDPYLVAAKMADDAILAYHTALEVHGRAYSLFEELYYLTGRATRPVTFRSVQYRPVQFPKALRATGREGFAVDALDREGLDIRVAALERTLVDVLDRPDLAGGWEELWRSLEAVEFFHLDRVVEYALLLRNATTIAKVGYFLEQHAERYAVRDHHLAELRARRPKSPHYVAGARDEEARLLPGWNLVVPEALAGRTWQEVT
jgi:predicted transcriptional regulator of viral defense system